MKERISAATSFGRPGIRVPVGLIGDCGGGYTGVGDGDGGEVMALLRII